MVGDNRRGPVDRVLGLMPVDALIRNVDVQAVIERVDVNALIQRVDMDALLDRLDLDRVLARLDLDALIGRVDLNGLLEHLDVNSVVARIDVEDLIGRTDLGGVIVRSTSGVATRMADTIRTYGITTDRWLGHVVDKVLRRRSRDDGAIPGRRERAGFVTRFAAFLADVGISTGLFALISAVVAFTLAILLSNHVDAADIRPSIGSGIFTLWEFLYFFVSWATTSKTPGMAILGVRVERRDGRRTGFARALVRTLAFPLSLAFSGLGFIGIVLGREHRALHDVIAGTVVVYDWDQRGARLRELAERSPARLPAA